MLKLDKPDFSSWTVVVSDGRRETCASEEDAMRVASNLTMYSGGGRIEQVGREFRVTLHGQPPKAP